MHGVGPSTVLGGRYAVQRRLEQMPRAERWSAHDLTLERDVVIVCFSEHEPHADATLDAARRVAGLDNHRLVRVLDVGPVRGHRLLRRGGHPRRALRWPRSSSRAACPPRRSAGSPARPPPALEAARGRGLHHLQLTPHSQSCGPTTARSRCAAWRPPRRWPPRTTSTPRAAAPRRRGRRGDHVCRADQPLAAARARCRDWSPRRTSWAVSRPRPRSPQACPVTSTPCAA